MAMAKKEKSCTDLADSISRALPPMPDDLPTSRRVLLAMLIGKRELGYCPSFELIGRSIGCGISSVSAQVQRLDREGLVVNRIGYQSWRITPQGESTAHDILERIRRTQNIRGEKPQKA